MILPWVTPMKLSTTMVLRWAVGLFGASSSVLSVTLVGVAVSVRSAESKLLPCMLPRLMLVPLTRTS